MQLKKLAALLLVLAVCQSRFAVLAQEGSEAAAGQEQSDAGAPQESAAQQQQTTQQTNQEQQAPQLPQLPTNQKSESADPLNLGDAPDFAKDLDQPSNTLPPFTTLNSASVVAPNLAESSQSGLSLDIDRRIQQTEDLLNRMVWQLNRETSWANSVHDIIQNYQYKYTKVLSNIKKHTTAANKMRDLASTLKKARLHEILESDLSKATRELTELAASSTETTEDEGSYASLKDRVSLMKQDLEKMSHAKVNKVLHGVQDQLKAAADDAIPPPSADTLKGLVF